MSPWATWSIPGSKKPCQNPKSIGPFTWWHPQWVKIFDSAHQWHELLSWTFINRSKIPLKLLNFCLEVLGFNWCRRHWLPLTMLQQSVESLIYRPSQICQAILLAAFMGLAGYIYSIVGLYSCSACPSSISPSSFTSKPMFSWEMIPPLFYVHVQEELIPPTDAKMGTQPRSDQ